MYDEKDPQQDCEGLKDKRAMYSQDEESQKTKGKKATWNDDEEAVDDEIHTKKDCPPRFSTLFESKPMPVPVQHIEESHPRRKSGLYLSWPAVILLSLLLFFETVALFAYTAIGLYNNMPDRFMPQKHASAAVFDVAPAAAQAPVNIAPNFVIGSGDRVTVTETVTMYASTQLGTQALSTVAATSSPDAVAGMAALASDIRGWLQPVSSSATIPVVTITPGGATATSIVLVTRTTDSAVSAVRPTSFMTVFVAPSALAAQQVEASPNATSESAEAKQSDTAQAPDSTSTTSATSTISPIESTTSSTTTTTAPSEAKGTNGACFGGAGAVFLNCV